MKPPYVLATLVVLAQAGAASACSCLQSAPDDRLHDADVVFTGTIKDVETAADGVNSVTLPQGGGTGKPVTAIVTVTETWKGEPSEPARLATVRQDGANCGWTPHKGDSVTAFAMRHDGRLVTNMCLMATAGRARPDPAVQTVLYRYRNEVRRLRQAVAAKPDGVPEIHALARYLEAWNDRPAALGAYRKVTELAPKDGAAWLGIGRIRFGQKDWLAAQTALTRATANLTGDTADEARRLLGQAKLHGGGGLPQGSAWRGLQFSNLSAPGVDLRGADLTGAKLRKVDFRDADLSGATLADFVTYEGDLEDADLSGAHLDRADFFQSNLQRADLTRVRASGVKLESVRLEGARLQGADLSGAHLVLLDAPGVNFADADLSGANLRMANLRGADLSHAALAGAKLRGAYYDCATRLPPAVDPAAQTMIPTQRHCHDGRQLTADFTGRDLSHLMFSNLDLRGAVFRGADLTFTKFWHANLADADFTDATGIRADAFRGADLTGANFSDAEMKRSLFALPGQAGDFTPRTMAGATFDGVTLRRADLPLDADGKPHLKGADLRGAVLSCSGLRAGRPNTAAAVAAHAHWFQALDLAASGVVLADDCLRFFTNDGQPR